MHSVQQINLPERHAVLSEEVGDNPNVTLSAKLVISMMFYCKTWENDYDGGDGAGDDDDILLGCGENKIAGDKI